MKKYILWILFFASFTVLIGFRLDNAIVPKGDILSGGPPKDGIPAILKPNFIRPEAADFLNPDDTVIGVKIGDNAKAYPVKILNLHEVVNDTLGGKPLAVTF